MDPESKERGRDYLAADVLFDYGTTPRAGRNRPVTEGNVAAREAVSCARNGAPARKDGRSPQSLITFTFLHGPRMTSL
jgi:hypothetical protein